MEFPIVSVWENLGAEWAKVAEVATYTELAFAPRHLDAGTWSITCPYDQQALAFEKARLVTFDFRGYRMTGVVAQPNPSTDEQGATQLHLSGLDALSILSWALAWPDPTVGIGAQPYHDPSDPAPYVDDAETVLLDLIDLNLVTRRGMTITIPASASRGTTIRARPNFENLLELVAKKAKRGGIGVNVGLVDTSGTRAELTVSVYEPDDVSSRVRFAETIDGSLRSWSETEDAPTATRAIVGGAGAGASRLLRSVTTVESVAAATAWGGHREVFIDGPQSFDNDELDEAGTEAIDASESTSLTVEAAESAGLLAFRDYNVGDIASATLLTGLDITDVITQIEVKVGDDGVTVTPAFGDPDAGNPEVSLAQIVRGVKRDVKQLAARR